MTADPWIEPLKIARARLMAKPHGMACGGTCSTCQELSRINAALLTIAAYTETDGNQAATESSGDNRGSAAQKEPDIAGIEPRLNRVSGDASLGDVEIRFGPPDAMNFSAIDEVVASDAHVHLERMNKGQWSLIIESKNQRACFMINGKDTGRSPVTTQIFCIDPVGSVSDSAGEEKKEAYARLENPRVIREADPRGDDRASSMPTVGDAVRYDWLGVIWTGEVMAVEGDLFWVNGNGATLHRRMLVRERAPK